MGEYLQRNRADLARPGFDATRPTHRSMADDPLAGRLNASHRVRSVTQVKRALDASPRMRAHATLQQALNRDSAPLQREALLDDEVLAQAKLAPAQRQADADAMPASEDEEVLQGRSDVAQRNSMLDEDEALQGRFEPAQRRENRTGMPDRLKAGVESLSGLSLDAVRVHYNSAQPATVQAAAYAQGTDIHVAPGQERHVAHEAWHVVQQMQGRVHPTLQAKGVAINDDPGLEQEADQMGAAADRVPPEPAQRETTARGSVSDPAMLQRRVSTAPSRSPQPSNTEVMQRILIKVTTTRIKEGEPRVITKVEFAERVPTTVSSGQGDHTVAEALVELALERFCIGKTHAQVAAGLPSLLYHLDQDAVAKYKAETGGFETATINTLLELMRGYQEAADSGKYDSEDLNLMLDHIFEIFLRLWNKRAGAAYAKSAGMTFGGGKEKEGKKGILSVIEQTDINLDMDPAWKFTLARNLVRMIDFNAAKGGLPAAAKVVVTAFELLLTAFPDAEFHYNDVATLAVEVFAEGANLNAEQTEALDRAVFERLRGPDEDEEKGESTMMEGTEEDYLS